VKCVVKVGLDLKSASVSRRHNGIGYGTPDGLTGQGLSNAGAG